MKKYLHHPSLLIVVLALLLLPVSLGIGQSQPESSQGLLIEQQEDASKSIVIPTGTRLKVVTHSGEKIVGVLNAVSDSSLTLGSRELPYAQAQKVNIGKGKGSRIGGVVGIVLGTIAVFFGFVFGLIGGVHIANSDSSADGCFDLVIGFFLLFLGLAVGILGMIFLLVGLVAYTSGKVVGRSFRLAGKWRLKRSVSK